MFYLQTTGCEENVIDLLHQTPTSVVGAATHQQRDERVNRSTTQRQLHIAHLQTQPTLQYTKSHRQKTEPVSAYDTIYA